jgi:hypothetical protein
MFIGSKLAQQIGMKSSVQMISSLWMKCLIGVTFLGTSVAWSQSRYDLSAAKKDRPRIEGKEISAVKEIEIEHSQSLNSKSHSSELRLDSLRLEKLVNKQIKSDLEKQRSFGIDGEKLLGGDGSGGGNNEEIAFVTEAIRIYEWLNLKPSILQKEFGFDLSVYRISVAKTRVSCALEPYLSFLREKHKKAYFIAALKTIFLDCEKFDEMKSDTDIFRSLVFHEYSRSAQVEGEDVYKYSSRIPSLIARIWNETTSPSAGIYGSQGNRMKFSIIYFGQTPILTTEFYYDNHSYKATMDLEKSADGVWVGKGQIELKALGGYACQYPVKVEMIPLQGYVRPAVQVRFTMPESLPGLIEKDCPQPSQKSRVSDFYQ